MIALLPVPFFPFFCWSTEGDDSNVAITFFFLICCSAAMKAMVALLPSFFFFFKLECKR
jgi:hypothetical protein